MTTQDTFSEYMTLTTSGQETPLTRQITAILSGIPYQYREAMRYVHLNPSVAERSSNLRALADEGMRMLGEGLK